MRLCVEDVKRISKALFVAYGLKEEDAVIASDCLVDAELAGIQTHGIAMLPAHVKKLQSGYDVDARLEIEKGTAAFTVCNAHNGIGMVSAAKCAMLAAKKAALAGVHMVLCRHANTFSAAYCYAKYIVEQGKIGIICCNSPAQMAPFGGKEKLLGTNPLAIGIPAKKEAPFILDMATSAVAKSKINQALQKNEQIPLGWATDMDGNPTNDPKTAISGLLLPMSGPKGSGLSMSIDILSGVLAQASYLDKVGRFYSQDNACMDVGHLFIAMDPELIYGEEFYDEMDAYLHRIRASEPAVGEAVYVPGDPNALHRQRCEEEGIEVPDGLMEQVKELFAGKGLPCPDCKQL